MSSQQEVPLSYELDGVIEDYERNGTFDAVSLATVKRVREAIVRGERRIDGTPYHEYIMQEIQRLPPEKPCIERELEWLREQHARDSAELAALRKRIEDAPWQPIETAPKDRLLSVLTWDGKRARLARRDVYGKNCNPNRYRTVGGAYHLPTHWMPLPPPPEEE